jgi:hypothetical protein
MGRCVCFISSRSKVEELENILVPLGYLVNSYTGNNQANTLDENGNVITM